MPPGPAYNWFCVLYSAAQIIGHAARCRGPRISSTTSLKSDRRRKDDTQDFRVIENLKESQFKFGVGDIEQANQVCFMPMILPLLVHNPLL